MKTRYFNLALSLLLLLPCTLRTVQAQTAGTISSYSRYGLGLLRDQSQGFNKSMGGVGQGMRIGNRVNTTNPASYSAIDSLSLIFDVGMSASFGQMKKQQQKAGVQNATLDYVHIGMRLGKRLGLALGFMPYSSIGYDFMSSEHSRKTIAYDPDTGLPISLNESYSGSGGLNQAYIGLGWRTFHNISIGANVSFLWGKYNHLVISEGTIGDISSTSFINPTRIYDASLRTYKIDLGVQYPVRLAKEDGLNLGLTASIGHKIAQDAVLMTGETADTASAPFDLPYSIGFGTSWQHKNTLIVAADVNHEFWNKCRMPAEVNGDYMPVKGYYMGRTRVAAGVQWTPNPYGKFWDRIQYRAGVNYTTPYLKVNGNSGPKEISISVGAGIPIINRINNRSVVNFGLQWLNRSASAPGMISENYMVINLGMTFNERWFMKFKID